MPIAPPATNTMVEMQVNRNGGAANANVPQAPNRGANVGGAPFQANARPQHLQPPVRNPVNTPTPGGMAANNRNVMDTAETDFTADLQVTLSRTLLSFFGPDSITSASDAALQPVLEDVELVVDLMAFRMRDGEILITRDPTVIATLDKDTKVIQVNADLMTTTDNDLSSILRGLLDAGEGTEASQVSVNRLGQPIRPLTTPAARTENTNNHDEWETDSTVSGVSTDTDTTQPRRDGLADAILNMFGPLSIAEATDEVLDPIRRDDMLLAALMNFNIEDGKIDLTDTGDALVSYDKETNTLTLHIQTLDDPEADLVGILRHLLTED